MKGVFLSLLALLVAGGLNACADTGELQNGTVYAMVDWEESHEDVEQVALTVVDYDPETGLLGGGEGTRRVFPMAEGLTLGGRPAGKPGTQERTRAILTCLAQPLLSSSIQPDTIALLELHLERGRVTDMKWIVAYPFIPQGDLYDEASGLYYSPDLGVGLVLPPQAAPRLMVRVRREEGYWSLRFLDRRAVAALGVAPDSREAEALSILTVERAGGEPCLLTPASASGGRPPQDLPEDAARDFLELAAYSNVMADQFFLADSVTILAGGEGEVAYQDPASGARFTLPGELAEGLVIFSIGRHAFSVDAASGRTNVEEGSFLLLCLHREMLGQIPVSRAYENRCGVFALDLHPVLERYDWSFGWERAYSWVKLSEGAAEQCAALRSAQAAIAASLDTSALE